MLIIDKTINKNDNPQNTYAENNTFFSGLINTTKIIIKDAMNNIHVNPTIIIDKSDFFTEKV